MIPKSGNRFSEKIMLEQKSMIPKKPAPGLDPGVGFFGKDHALVTDGRREFAHFQIPNANLWKKPLDVRPVAERGARREHGGRTRRDGVTEGVFQRMSGGEP